MHREGIPDQPKLSLATLCKSASVHLQLKNLDFDGLNMPFLSILQKNRFWLILAEKSDSGSETLTTDNYD